MPQYRRAISPGGSFFFTLVTYRRARFLNDALARRLLHESLGTCASAMPFMIDSMVLLPDHLHAMLTLPPRDTNFSGRWSRVKRSFTRSWLAAGGWEGATSVPRRKNRRRGVWQRRFWEHVIRDQRDYNAHLDYICYNPFRHGLVSCPHDWPWLWFHQAVQRGVYEPTWCCCCDERRFTPPDFESLDVDDIEVSFGE